MKDKMAGSGGFLPNLSLEVRLPKERGFPKNPTMPNKQLTQPAALKRASRLCLAWAALAWAVAGGAFDHGPGFGARAGERPQTPARFPESGRRPERIHGAPSWAIGYGAEFWHRAPRAEVQ